MRIKHIFGQLLTVIGWTIIVIGAFGGILQLKKISMPIQLLEIFLAVLMYVGIGLLLLFCGRRLKKAKSQINENKMDDLPHHNNEQHDEHPIIFENDKVQL